MQKKCLLFSGLALILGCSQPQKNFEPASNIDRNIASGEIPTDFTPNRENFDGSGKSLTREWTLMKGNLERAKILELSADRDALLNKNLFDTGTENDPTLDCKRVMAMDREDFVMHHRTADGSCYMYKMGQFLNAPSESKQIADLNRMGAKEQRFGRNTPPPTEDQIQKMEDSLLKPSPVEVAKTFFSRDVGGFKPVPWVNFLATAWLQAENHDWFSHGKNVDESHMKGLPPEVAQKFAKAFQPLMIDGFMFPRTRPDVTALQGLVPPQVYPKEGGQHNLEGNGHRYGFKSRNAVTHWWDASHIYGSDAATVRMVRTIPAGETYKGSDGKTYEAGSLYPDGKIAVDEKNRKLFYRPDPRNDGELLPITGFHDNWWAGLEMIHTVFALEHNKIADHMRKEFETRGSAGGPAYKAYFALKKDPAKLNDYLFNKSRLVLAALIAKIHTVEWTPAILDNPGLRMGMFANWNGLKTTFGDPESVAARGMIQAILGQNFRALVSGLTGKGTLNLYKVPFTLTEEFVSVYRMHPLLADKIDIYSHTDHGRDIVQRSINVDDTRDSKVDALMGNDRISTVDWMYSFGRNRAGLMTLHNHPKFMENIEIRRNVQGQKTSKPIMMNMGAVDVFRDRERQVPRYNEFRRALRMRPLKNFVELFVTSKVLYEDASMQSKDYQRVITALRASVKASRDKDGKPYDVPMIERDYDKIAPYQFGDITKSAIKGAGGIKGILKTGGLAKAKESVLNSGNNLISEDEFYNLYFKLPKADQDALLTAQELQDVKNMKSLYMDNVENLDLLVGTLGEEDRFDIFGFGNTPFFIFALMASRRLMTDPFLSDLYTDDVYTATGRQWVEKETMISVISRNFPELKPKFKDVKNAFHPWNPN